MKIYRVQIDNDPGGWKSGEDPTILVIANNPEEAIALVKEGKTYERSEYGNDNHKIIYSKDNDGSHLYRPYVSVGAHITAAEIVFDGFEIFIGKSEIRKKKLEELGNV